jgi:hypothetical protein
METYARRDTKRRENFILMNGDKRMCGFVSG